MKIRLRHDKLAFHLARSRMSQNRWAQKLGLHKGHLSRLTNGQRSHPGPETRQKLLEGLGLPFDELFEIEGAETPGRARRFVKRLRRSTSRWMPGATRGWSGEIRQAFRALRRQPGFALMALATVALGVGANTAIFTLVNGILLQPLPFSEPDRLVYVWSVRNEGTTLGRLSFQDYLTLADEADTLQSLAAISADDLTWVGGGGAERISAEMVTAPFFSALGVAPVRGRPLLASETRLDGPGAVVVISHDFWQAKLGGAAGVVGSTLRLNGLPYDVVGLMPPGFRGLEGAAQLWVPLTQMDTLHPDLKQYDLLQSRGTRFLMAIGRRAEGAGLVAIQDQLSAVAARLRTEFPRTNEDKGLRAEPLNDVIRGDFRTPVLWLMGAVALVLLIAVANLAHLSLARSAQRIREVAIRTALGAEVPRMIRHLLTESLLLAVAGGFLGLLLAQAALVRILALLPDGLPSYATPSLDGRVLLFSVLLSVIVGAAFGLAPALLAVRRGAADALKQNSGNVAAGRGRRRLTSALVVAEIALSLALLVGSGLMLQGLYRATSFDPGFDAGGLISASFDLPLYKFSEDEQARLLDAVVEQVSALPGVDNAALCSHLYFGDGYMTGEVSRADDLDEVEIGTQMMWVTPGFFRTLGLQLQEGRDFAAGDQADAPAVGVVSRSFAEEAWPGESPVGKVLRTGTRAEATTTIVGVVDSVVTRRGGPAPNQLYFAVAQGGLWSRSLLIRSARPAVVLPSLRAAIQEVDPEIPIFQVTSMESLVSQTFASTRLLALLTTIFAGAALLLAVVGVYGVMAFTVAQARAEVGIRLALGARPADVTRQYLAYGGRRAVSGLLLGLGLVFLLIRTFATQLPDVESFDPRVIAGVSLLLLTVALLACWVPAWRASRVDPLETVRAE